jgi:anti-sigma B factor antagonist
MEIRQEDKQNISILYFSGKIVGAPDVNSIKESFSNLIAGGKTDVIVDLGGLDLINSSGLGSLIGNMNVLKQSGGRLKFSNVSENVLQVLKITRLDTVFDIYDSLDEAIDSLQKSS